MDDMIPYVIYAVKLPERIGWLPGVIHNDTRNPEDKIRAAHPAALDIRIVKWGAVKPSASRDLFAGKIDPWTFLSQGWWFDPDDSVLYAPDELPPRRMVDCIPAEVRLATEPPEYGWWRWMLTILPDQSVMDASSDRPAQTVQQFSVHCSWVYNPIDDILAFLKRLDENKDCRLCIDEEGMEIFFTAWMVGNNQIHLYINTDGRDTDFTFDLLLGKASFVRELRRAHQTFVEQGEWGSEYLDEDEE